jgi:hypothetical protein
MFRKLTPALLGLSAMLVPVSHAAIVTNTNLLVNGDFELPAVEGQAPTGWNGAGAGVAVVTDDLSNTGTWSLQRQDPAGTAGTGNPNVNQDINLGGDGGGLEYTASVVGLFPENDRPSEGDFRIGLVFFDASNNNLGSVVESFLGANTNEPDEWIEKELTGVLPAGTTTVNFQLIHRRGNASAPNTGGNGYMDSASFVLVPEPGSMMLISSGILLMFVRRSKD